MRKRILIPPTPKRRVIEYRSKGAWVHDQTVENMKAARRAVNALTDCGWQARSRLDPRNDLNDEQRRVLYALREQLPSRWRAAIRQLWRADGVALVYALLEREDVAILRRMGRSHGPKWLAAFWFVFD